MSKNKIDYIKLCETESSVPIFMQPWWLDAVCTVPKDSLGDGLSWDVAVAKDKNGNITAALCFCEKQKWGFKKITMPHLTKYCGVWMRPISLNLTPKEIELYEHEILKTLILQIPFCHFLTLQLHFNTQDWSPFYWANFKQTTRYTQVITGLKNIDELYKNLSHDVQRNIKKANAHFNIQPNGSFEQFWRMHNAVFERQKIHNPIPLSIWEKLHTVLKEKNQSHIYISSDDKNDIHGALYLIWDNQTAYILASGSTEMGRKYGVMSQLIWKAIEDSVGFVENIDFLGSMLPQIELFNRRFNTDKKAYSVITKSSNKWVDILF